MTPPDRIRPEALPRKTRTKNKEPTLSDTMTRETPVDGALWLVRHGFAVFPVDHPGLAQCAGIGLGHDPATCTDRGKHPSVAFTRGHTLDEQQVQRDIGGTQLRNVGVAIGASPGPEGQQLLVIDSDRPGAIEDAARQLGHEHTTTMRVTTAKGYHDYYWAPPTVKLGNGLGTLKGVFDGDVRGSRGYVIGPGSVHASGVVYELADPEQPPVDAPAWLITALTTKPTPAPAPLAGPAMPISTDRLDRYTRRVVEDECTAITRAANGEQNNTINTAAFNLGTLVGAGALTENEARDHLLAAARAGGHPDGRAIGTVNSGLTAGIAQPRNPWPPVARDRRSDFSSLVPEQQQAPTPAPMAPAAAADAPAPAARRHSVDITHEPDAILSLTDAVRGSAIPDTYVRNGELVQVAEVSGDTLSQEQHGLKHVIQGIGPDSLRRLLARHADVYRMKPGRKDEGPQEVPASPTVAVCKAVLTETSWPGLPPLANLVGAPVLRPDGTVLQDPGYDTATAIYYAPHSELPRVPDVPAAEDIDRALEFVLDHVLGDFPWVTDSDRANYVALLISPILRPYIGGLMPLGAISAADRGSGKTLLADVIGSLYGATVRPWVGDDDELRKAITAALMGSSAIITLDNVDDKDSVDAPSLAKLLTSPAWDDRVLGRSEQARLTNDRLWLVTGNNIRFGGDIAQRSVLVQLDPKCPRPDLRTGFRIPDLDEWLEDHDNRARLLHSLLLLCRAWIVGGAPRGDYAMRSFRRWARALGGFLSFHGINGFLDNASQLEQQDEEAAAWSGFLATWHDLYGGTPRTATDLLQSAQQAAGGYGAPDPWAGTFITRANGTLPTPRGLGMMLTSRRGRYFGDLVLRGEQDKHKKTWHYHVERDPKALADTTPGAGE